VSMPCSETRVTRRAFLGATGLALLATPLGVEAQPAANKVWRIGWLSPPSAATGASEFDALRDGLRELN
jgi:hypothetical protein